jgi:hypothetical protein
LEQIFGKGKESSVAPVLINTGQASDAALAKKMPKMALWSFSTGC